MAGPIHYEVYVRKTALSDWTLLIASENRRHALEAAREHIDAKQAVAVRVTKETLDPDTMAFQSVVILNLGLPEQKVKASSETETRPACSTPVELYAPHARMLVARVLEDWLKRQGVTAFELLHRPDLAEILEASGVELQHAVQKIAVPEAQASGQEVHAMIRHYQRLADATVARLLKARRDGRFPALDKASVADVARRLVDEPERVFAMGGVVSQALAGKKGARARLDALMDLVASAPADGPERALVLGAVEQIAAEMLAVRANVVEILEPSLDLGANLAAVIRMITPREVEALVAVDGRMARLTPQVEGPARRLGDHLAAGGSSLLTASLTRMVVRELTGQRRLRPSDPVGEIDILRVLAMGLTASAGRLLSLEEVQNAFIERSRRLVAADFVAAYVKDCPTALAEAEQLARLCENVTGGASKRAAARWLLACIAALRFETEMRQSTPGGPTAAQRLATLARLQRSVRISHLGEPEETQILGAIGVVGGAVEADVGLTAQISRAKIAPLHRLGVLLRLAAGETAPIGPAADRARAEALRLLRAPEVRTALADAPGEMAVLKPLMQTAGLAA